MNMGDFRGKSLYRIKKKPTTSSYRRYIKLQVVVAESLILNDSHREKLSQTNVIKSINHQPNSIIFYSNYRSIKPKNYYFFNLDFPDVFQPNVTDHEWYKFWEEKNFFKAKESAKKTFTMILPPPNVTGTLHLGHALTTTVQDVLARW